jgi:polygalacturonase
MKQVNYNVNDFGATGIAVAAETLRVENLQYNWLVYKEGTQATIYRAKPGAELDSIGIQKAIDTAYNNGGGTVIVPAGDYLIGPIELKSFVQLQLEPGARLWGSPDIKDYEPRDGEVIPPYTLSNGYNRSSEGLDRDFRRLFSANKAQNFSIVGAGQISAQSPAFVIPWLNSHPTDLLSLYRPQDTFIFYKCSNVRLDGIQVLNTPSWSIVFDTCVGVQVHALKLDCFKIINSDGIDLVNSSKVTISDCHLNCTDDAICLKNTVPNATMGNIAVTNCVLRTLCNGFKIGTDSVGNFENVSLNNLIIRIPDDEIGGDRGGININALDGGTVKNINVSNVVMHNVFCPFYFYATARTGPQEALGLEKRPGKIQNVSLTNIIADGTRYPCYAVGDPERSISDLYISNVNCIKEHDFYTEQPPMPVPHVPDVYPTPFTFGTRDTGDQLPTHGLYLRNVDGATIRDFKVTCLDYDCREVFFAESCEDIESSGLKTKCALDVVFNK